MEKNDAFYKSFPFTLIATLVISGALWFIFGKMYGMSFALGSITSLFMMSMLHRSSKRILESDKTTASRLATRNYFFRFFFYAIILVSAGLLDSLDILTTGLGLFLFKIVFYIILFIDGKRGEENV